MDNVKNGAYSRLASGITSSAVSLTVLTGTGARFHATPPYNLNIYDSLYANWAEANVAGKAEIVRCTGISTDTLTVTRAQESTTAKDFNETGHFYIIEQTVTNTLLGSITSPVALIASGTLLLGQGLTRYIQFSDATITTGATDFKLYLPAKTAQLLRVSGTSNSASSFTCTLMVNGAASALTVSVTTPSGGAWATGVVDSTNTVTLSANNYVCLRLVMAGGSASLTAVSAYMELA